MWTLQTARNQVAASRPSIACQGVASHRATIKTVRERILRYPDGMERRIVYPTTEGSTETSQDVDYIYEYLPHDSFDSAWQQRMELQGGLSTVQVQKKQTYNFNWAAVKKRAQALDQEVARSYQVFHGCPWVMPKAMYVVAISHNFMGAQQHFYTMRVRVTKSQEVTDELGRVLGNASLASNISMSDMLDGVVAFSSREQAERFVSKMLDEDSASNMDAHICEMTSHELFKMSVTEAKGCVVAVGFNGISNNLDDTYIPSPSQLSTSLRGQSTV